MLHKGKFTPKNRQKYKGDATNIIYRSSWERAFMNWCDTSSKVVKWNSEQIRIPYISSINNNKVRRYFVDFWLLLDDDKQYLVEIKPEKQTKKPQKPSVKTKKAIDNYLYAEMMYRNNIDKWMAGLEYCKKYGYSFIIMTENKLRNMGIPINGK